jgi:hypothetical protein
MNEMAVILLKRTKRKGVNRITSKVTTARIIGHADRFLFSDLLRNLPSLSPTLMKEAAVFSFMLVTLSSLTNHIGVVPHC